jgi:hypothetical protein
MTKADIEEAFKKLQLEIISSLELADGSGKFQFDEWQREEGGGGLTSVLENGKRTRKRWRKLLCRERFNERPSREIILVLRLETFSQLAFRLFCILKIRWFRLST